MALKYSANKLQLLVPTAKRHTQAKFTQDNISVRPSNVDKIVKAIYEDLEDISASLGITQSFSSLTDTPSEYTDVGNMLVGVNSTEDGIEFKNWAISASTLYPSGTNGNLGKEGNAIQKVFIGNSGNIDYQQDLSILSAGVQKAVFKQTTGYLGLGVNNPLEPLHSSNGIVIGNAVQSTPGTIRYFEGDFKGYDGTDWKSFTILPEGYFNTLINDSDDITEGSTNLFLTTSEQTKLSNISITQPVDLDILESNVTANNAKVSNANHSGDMSGSTTLTAQPELITNKTSVSATALDSLLISDQSDSSNLKKITIQSILDLTPTPDWGNIGGTLSNQTDLQNALNAKENSITAGTTGQYWRGDKTFQTLDKTAVGLSNVDNTSDANKPISSATQTALNAKLSNVVEDTTPQLGGDLDLNNNDINGTGNVDITGNVIADIVQLRGGVGTQGEMSWSTDEETIKLIMDGTTLHIGQDTFVHARNNTDSIITKGTPVYATGTLGASGRITVAPMIADGTIAGRYFIGLAAEDIAIDADGQVMTFGKIRQINTSGYTDGDVLWISPTVAGELTTTEPTAPNLKIATAFVIHAATNGTLMVRAEQGTDLHSDQRVQVSGLTDGDVLTWSNANQRWENEQPVDTNFANTNLTLTGNRTHNLNGNSLNINNGATNVFTINEFNDVIARGKGTTNNNIIGFNTARSLTSSDVTILGDLAGQSLTTGGNNVLLGRSAGQGLTTGPSNVMIGRDAGLSLTTISESVFIGRDAGRNITGTPSRSVVIGAQAMRDGGGTDNTAIGNQALLGGGTQFNVAVGALAGSTNVGGGTNVFIGYNAQPLSNTNFGSIVIGGSSVGYGSNTAVLGASSITLTRLRGRVEMNQITSQPTITDNSSYAIWFNGGIPTIRLKDNLGISSNIAINDTNFANTDLTLTGNRTHNLNGNTLSFSGGRVSFDTTTNGILLPRMTTAEMNAIVSPATHLLVFNTDLNGLYRYNGSAWVALSTGYGIISVNNASGAPTYYATFKSAVDAIGGNGVVNLHSNISVTAVGEMPTIGTNDTLTINGNGYTITHTCNSGSDFHLVDCTSNTAKIYLNNVKIVSNGTASGSYVASVFGGINNSASLIELSSDSIITTTNNGIREFGTIRGGTLICSNGVMAIASTIKNAEVTTKYASASMFNCNVTVVSGGYIGNGGAYEINRCNITGDATSVTPIRLEPNAKFWNNNVVITTGGQDAIYIQSGTPDKWININNCYIRHLGTGRGIFGENVSEIHNTTVYAESNVACYTQQGYPTYAYNGHTIKNCTFITNSATHSAYSSLNVNTRSLHNVTAVCRNASNTAPAFNINMGYTSAILTVTDCEAIVNNASAYNFQTTGSSSGAYIYGLKMSVIGLGMNLSTTLLNTNTPDAFGNVKMG